MRLSPLQQVMLTVLLGPEDPKAWARWKKSEYGRKRYLANPGKLLASSRKWKKKNPEKNRAHARKCYWLNPEKRRASSRKWRLKNLVKVQASQKRKLESNPNYKIAVYTRTRVRVALKGNLKAARTCELLDCSIPELRTHLESLFKPGMTWENYGPVWHVDHKRPCASFDLTVPAQQRECFHWTNLQPLFAQENLQKGAS